MPNFIKLREVPEDRIKILHVQRRLDNIIGIDDGYIRQCIWREAGFGIAEKLIEFNKIEITKTEDSIEFKLAIEIIVPPTPEANLNAQPRSTNRSPSSQTPSNR